MLPAQAILQSCESPLLLLPLEIRNDIYSRLLPSQVHISFFKDAFHLAKCIEPRQEIDKKTAPCADASDPLIRKNYGCYGSHPKATCEHASRLRSTWGPHWRCEEAAVAGSSESRFDNVLLLVCRTFYLEVVDLLVRTTEFHVTDMTTVNHLKTPKTAPLTLPSTFPVALQNLTQLSVAMRLPLAFYQAWHCPNMAATLSPEITELVKSWMEVSSSLICLPHLKTLRIWLDHDEPDSWSHVNERALLAPLSRIFQIEALKSFVCLPNLHPKLEREDLHFIQDTSLAFILQRRIRQLFFSNHSSNNARHTIRKPSFPFLAEAVEYAGKTMYEVEMEEREWWKKGYDMEEEVREFLNTFYPRHGSL